MCPPRLGKELHSMNWLFSHGSFLLILQALSGPSPFLRSFCVDDHLLGQAPAALHNPLRVLCLYTLSSSSGPACSKSIVESVDWQQGYHHGPSLPPSLPSFCLLPSFFFLSDFLHNYGDFLTQVIPSCDYNTFLKQGHKGGWSSPCGPYYLLKHCCNPNKDKATSRALRWFQGFAIRDNTVRDILICKDISAYLIVS